MSIFIFLIYLLQSTRPRGARPALAQATTGYGTFQSTHLLRGATIFELIVVQSVSHFNPRTSCEARLYWIITNTDTIQISIHAPLARRDVLIASSNLIIIISIHAPLARRDHSLQLISNTCFLFQSTHLLRGATL